MTEIQYEKWTGKIKNSDKLCKGIIILNKVFTYMFYILFIMLILLQYLLQENWLFSLITAAVSFVAVSLFRRIYNKQRPYEKLNIEPIIKRKGKGKSFPSRHIFSIYLIATLWFLFVPPVGIGLMILGVFAGVIRVIGGVHYRIDVICGAILGIFCVIAAILLKV